MRKQKNRERRKQHIGKNGNAESGMENQEVEKVRNWETQRLGKTEPPDEKTDYTAGMVSRDSE
jgi:hypothetical protein